LNEVYQLLLYIDDVSLLEKIINILKIEADASLITIMEVSLEINAEKTVHMRRVIRNQEHFIMKDN
jgi:hypothetical protein